MARIEKEIEVRVPLRTAYDQWTQFEEFPQFMEGVKQVQQLDDTHLHWRARVGGKELEWDAEIVEQVPDQRIVWRSTTGKPNAGSVEFQAVDGGCTRVCLAMDYDPEGVVENVGDAIGVTSRRVEKDLERFKDFIEARGTETGQWRGEVHGGHKTGTGGSGGMGASGLDQAMGGTTDGLDTGNGVSTPGTRRNDDILSRH